MRVLADPDRRRGEAAEVEPFGQQGRGGALRDDRHIRPEGEQRIELAMQRHGAVQGH